MDIKNIVESVIKKASTDKNFAKQLKADPKKAITSLLGKELAQDKLDDVLGALKGKIDFASLLDSDGDGKPDLGAIGKVLGKK